MAIEHTQNTWLGQAYELAYAYAMKTNQCIFLTGKAGTGKTTFLRRLRRECPKQMVVVAPTGVAAINAEGVTIHSLFQLPPQVFVPTPQDYRNLISEIQMRLPKQRVLRQLEMLVIDEVSMVRADLLDAIDALLRHYRHRNLPFGGVQMLFIGDLYQLSPVAKEEEWQLLSQYYTGPYFFQARVFSQLRPVYIELDHVFRQSDQRFVDLLNEVRNNCLSPANRDLLNSRYCPDWNPKQSPDFHITLSTHNRKVDAINHQEMEQLPGRSYKYHAIIQGNFPESMYPVEEELVLKKGARVMFIRNDSSAEKQYYNGRIGIVVQIDEDKVVVECTTPEGKKEQITVHEEEWTNLRYTTNKQTETIEAEQIGSYRHLPLRLAWAVTIHKAQGLSFDHAVIDAADAFASGQVYVALSRCRSLEGLVLLSPIPERALTNARDVLSFVAMQPPLNETEQALQTAERTYLIRLLLGLYDFHDALQAADRISRLLLRASSFNEQAKPYISSLQQSIGDLQPTAEAFGRQLQSILQAAKPDPSYLSQRLKAAGQYFTERTQKILDQMRHSPAYTDDRADAKEYKELMEALFSLLDMQRYMMEQIDSEPNIQGWFRYRQRYQAPTYRLSAHGSTETEDNNTETAHTELLNRLKRLRYQVGKENGREDKLFTIAYTKTLVAICNRLPVTKRELMSISGIGPKTYELWGDRILRAVKRYLAEQGIETQQELNELRQS